MPQSCPECHPSGARTGEIAGDGAQQPAQVGRFQVVRERLHWICTTAGGSSCRRGVLLRLQSQKLC